MGKWWCQNSTRVVAAVGALFPPQVRDWGLPAEVPLTPRAARRVAREGAAHSFDQAALALNEDWDTHRDGKQVQRWAEALGEAPEAAVLAGEWRTALWDGQVGQVISGLQRQAARLGAPQATDGPEHPRRVLDNNVNYFQTHRAHMDYPAYRRKDWPIGSGVTESAVKQFNKRVKGTEQFWSLPGVEAILSLRALWLSQDGRWRRYWDTRPAYSKAA